MYTPRHIINDTYVWFFDTYKDANFMKKQLDKWRHVSHTVIYIDGYGYLVKNELGKLFDARGRIPSDVFRIDNDGVVVVV